MSKETPWRFSSANNPNKINWKDDSEPPKKRQVMFSPALAKAWRPRFIELCERIAILSPSEADLKRIEQCVDSIETINQWNKEDFKEEATACE